MEQELKWENALITQATEAQKSFECEESIISEDHALIKLAYEQCEKITYDNSRTFFMASNLLPEAKKRGARALYAFCRVSDDLVDRPEINASHKSLEDWRARTINTQPASDDMIAYAWDHTSRHFCIPWAFAEQLIDGVAMDLRKPSYQTIDELANYCYGVACTVGLMSMHIIGFESEDAVPYAIRLGVALQLTNILRDVGEDLRMGRIYLPHEEIKAFGITEEDMERGVVNDRWRDFMKYQIDRTRKLYDSSFPGIALLDPDGRFAIGAAAELYQAILENIEKNDYDVFNKRASIGKFSKLRRLPGIWWRTRNGYHREIIPSWVST